MGLKLVAKIFTAIVALEHIYILWIEMFAWTTQGKEVFRNVLPTELFEPTRGLAANQGLYNGFLAVGLLWSLSITERRWAMNIRYFFLGCVIVAASYGAFRSDPSILLKQGSPAILALILSLCTSIQEKKD